MEGFRKGPSPSDAVSPGVGRPALLLLLLPDELLVLPLPALLLLLLLWLAGW